MGGGGGGDAMYCIITRCVKLYSKLSEIVLFQQNALVYESWSQMTLNWHGEVKM